MVKLSVCLETSTSESLLDLLSKKRALCTSMMFLDGAAIDDTDAIAIA